VYRETHVRSVTKAVSWRLMGTLATSLIVFAVTRRLALSVAVGIFEFVSKIGFFWLHERLWDRLRFGREEVRPVVVWLTGLPASGKSTLSQRVAEALRGKGFRVEQLDGEMVRRLFPRTGFTRPERDEHVRRLGFLASRLEQQGVCVVAATVSPYADSRDFVRRLCWNFVEVHVATPIAECERRDPKGLYAQARRGEIQNFTGIDDPYEAPVEPDVRVDTSTDTVEQAGARVLAAVERRMQGRSRPSAAGSGDVAQPRKSLLDDRFAFGRIRWRRRGADPGHE
jgi:adenylylsulfate kinase